MGENPERIPKTDVELPLPPAVYEKTPPAGERKESRRVPFNQPEMGPLPEWPEEPREELRIPPASPF